MNKFILDASALLAVLLEEPGAEQIARGLEFSMISTVNVSEVVASSVERGLALKDVISCLARLPMKVISFDAEQAYIAASFRPATRSLGLSLGDRACLALGYLKKLPVFTADQLWLKANVGVKVNLIR